MVAYLAWRLVHLIFVLLGLSILIFLITRVMPGDPARLALGARASPEAVEAFRARMGLDQPLHVQYHRWLAHALRGDMGMSIFTRRPVARDVREFLPATLELMLFAGVVMIVGGILLGILAAWHANSWIDNAVRLLAYVGVVTPAFVFAIVLLLVFGYLLDLLPTAGRLSAGVRPPPVVTGMITVDSLLAGQVATAFNALKHMLLPGLALAMAGLSQQARITRASMIDNLQRDYILAARAAGIPERVVMTKYLLKPSLIPTVSILGLDFAALMANAFLVEMIFNWPGLSRYGVNAMLSKDLNAITAVVLVIGVVFMSVNIVVDLIVSYLDPRIRLRSGQ
ncbi:MAG: ABC transporter permease [Armatimonadota bacterium]|nr:ABC transporter permease [Armatimonadota bacterium]MDR5698012.1 ABC transporter permease [Armatimonadota bacterium]